MTGKSVIARSEATKQSRAGCIRAGLLRFARNDEPRTTKAPRKTAGLLFDTSNARDRFRKEDIPFLADLAATYSSKP
jgi:hypothetical protein